jgi:HlyD family secretion protein
MGSVEPFAIAPPRTAKVSKFGRRFWTTGFALVGLIFAVGGIAKIATKGVHLDTALVTQGLLRVTVSGTGKARVRERHTVSASVSGRLERIELLPGDFVKKGQVLAVIGPAAPTLLDARSRAAQRARVEAAVAAENVARAALVRARGTANSSEVEWERARQLAATGAITAKATETAELELQSRKAELQMAESSVRQAHEEAEAARALLVGLPLNQITGAKVIAVVDGRVLRVLKESEGDVQVGTPLLELGDLGDLELAVDLLTADAVRVVPGAKVEVLHWGGDQTLHGVVRRIDPSGFTKVSALGVEEQRVNVIVGPKAPGAWANLSDNYRVETEIIVTERPNTILVPVGSLIHSGDGWRVFTVENGRCKQRSVHVGQIGSTDAEIVSGLSVNERVVLYPGDQVQDGVRVEQK